MDAPTAEMACTENDSTETVNIAAEKPPSDSVADIVVADLSFSPPCRSSQLNTATTAKPGGKPKRRGEKRTGSFCVQGCKYKGKESDDMVQCLLCNMWVHCACGEQPDRIIGLWSCHTCRQLPNVIMNLVDKVSTLENTMLQIKENNADLAKLVKALCIVNDTVQEEKCALSEQLACLKG